MSVSVSFDGVDDERMNALFRMEAKRLADGLHLPPGSPLCSHVAVLASTRRDSCAVAATRRFASGLGERLAIAARQRVHGTTANPPQGENACPADSTS
jgi:hypothetical protein